MMVYALIRPSSQEIFLDQCYNRLYKKPYYRYDGEHLPFDIMNHQVKAAKDIGYQWIFISRRYPARYVMRKLVPLCVDVTGYKWIVSDNIHLVCDNMNDKGCWQDICYMSIQEEPDDFHILNNTISTEDYKNL